MEAKRDQNYVPVKLGTNQLGEVVPLQCQINPVTGYLRVLQRSRSPVIVLATHVHRDDNYVPVGVAERTDNGEPMAMQATPEKEWLVDLI